MKNVNSRANIRALLVAVAAFGASSSAFAATGSIPVSATIIPPITLTQPADLRLGNIAAGATAGTVAVVLPATLPAFAAFPTTATPTLGTRTNATAVAVGGLTCSATVLCGPGSLQISGLAAASFATVTVPATTTLTGPGPAMTLTTTKRYGADGTAGVITGAGTFGATGAALLYVGGSLAVGTSAAQTSGAYTGTLAIVVDY